MGCCSLRTGRQTYDEGRSFKKNDFRSDVYVNPGKILNIKDDSFEEKDTNPNIYDNFSPMEAEENDRYKSDDSKSQVSLKNMISKRLDNNSKKFNYSNSKSLKIIESLESNQNGGYKSKQNIGSDTDDGVYFIDIRVLNFKITNENIFSSLNIDFFNESYFNSNYALVLLINFNNKIYLLNSDSQSENLKKSSSKNIEKNEDDGIINISSKKDAFKKVNFANVNYNNENKSKSISPIRNSCLNNNNVNNPSIKFPNYCFEDLKIFYTENSKDIVNHYASFHLFLKNTKLNQNVQLIGEAMIPIEFLKIKIDSENNFEIPIVNKSENLILGNLNLTLVITHTNTGKQNNNEKNVDFQKNSIAYYNKYQTLKLNNYDKNILKKLNLYSQINGLDLNLIKIKYVEILKKYSIDNKKSEALIDLSEFLLENTGNSGIDEHSLDSLKNLVNSNTENEKTNIKKIIHKIDFHHISFSKYFIFISMLNESIIDQGERKNLITNSNFIYEKIIWIAYTKCDEKLMKNKKFENMVIGDVFFSLLLNLKKVSNIKFDSYYNDCIFIFRDLGNFFLNAKTNILFFIKENNTHKNQIIQHELRFINSKKNYIDYNLFYSYEKKEDCFYYLNYNVILKYFNILNNMIDLHIGALKDYPDNKNIYLKVDNLIENLKNNFEMYIIKKLDMISLNDLNLATVILQLFHSFAKLGQIYSSLIGISRTECYVNFIVDEYSGLSNWLSLAFNKFFHSSKFFKIFIELGELILANSPLIFCNYFLRLINLKQVYLKFNLDAKNLDSKKFNFWLTYLKFLFHLINNCKTDQSRMTDFYNINYEEYCNHFSELFKIIISYPYFKLLNSSNITFEKNLNLIFSNFNPNLINNELNTDKISINSFNTQPNKIEESLGTLPSKTDYDNNTSKNSNNFITVNSNSQSYMHYKKFMSNYQSVIIISKILDIFGEILFRKYIFNILRGKNKHILDKFFDYIFFLIFYQFDFKNFKLDYLKDLKVIYFSIYSKILKILYHMSENMKIDLYNLMKGSLKNIFRKNHYNTNDKEQAIDFNELNKNVFIHILYEKILFFKNEKSDKSFILMEKMINKIKK